MKMDDCFQKVFSDEQIFVAQNQGSILMVAGVECPNLNPLYFILKM